MAADLNVFGLNTVRPQERFLVNDLPGTLLRSTRYRAG